MGLAMEPKVVSEFKAIMAMALDASTDAERFDADKKKPESVEKAARLQALAAGSALALCKYVRDHHEELVTYYAPFTAAGS
jgi:hypothetical protein